MFFPGSRYYNLTKYQVTRPDGTVVQVTRVPSPGPAAVVGYLRGRQAQRLDQIAARFLADPTGFWQICDANNAVVPDALVAQDLIGVPLNAKVTT